MPYSFTLFCFAPFCIFRFYQTVSTQWSWISRGKKKLLTDPPRRMNHTALPRALPFDIPPPPHRLAALLHLLFPYQCLNILKRICGLMDLFLLTPGQFLCVTSVQSTIEEQNKPLCPWLPANMSCFVNVLPESVCISVLAGKHEPAHQAEHLKHWIPGGLTSWLLA